MAGGMLGVPPVTLYSSPDFFGLSCVFFQGGLSNAVGFRNGPGGVKSPVSTSPSIGAPRLSITSVVVAGLLLPSVVGTQAATSCHQKKR